MLMQFVLAALILIIILDELFLKDRKKVKLTKNINGPLDLPIIGGAHVFLKSTPRAVCQVILKILPNSYKDLYKIRVFNKFFIAVYNPVYVEKLLNSPQIETKGFSYELVMRQYFGEGIVGMPSIEKWRKRRKIMSPAFSQRNVNKFIGIFSEHAVFLTDRLKNIILTDPNQEENIVDEIGNYLAIIIGLGLFDTDWSKFNGLNHAKLLNEWSDEAFHEFFNWNTYIMFFTPLKRKFKHEHILSNLSKKIMKFYQEKNFDSESADDDMKHVINLLIKNYSIRNLTKTEVTEEIVGLYGAGIDTTHLTTCYTLMLLGMHPETQEKLYDEVIEVIGAHRRVEDSDLTKLKYTECVIKESLRVFPVASAFSRQPQHDIFLDEGITIPKHSEVIFHLVALHRNPEYWSDPLEFKPERFLPENAQNRHPYAYLPFAGGTRNCIGMRYAMNILKILIPTIVRRFKVKTSVKRIEDVDLLICVTTKPANGFGLSMEIR